MSEYFQCHWLHRTDQRLKRLFKVLNSKGDVGVGEGWVSFIDSSIVQIQLGLCCGSIHSFADLQ